MVTKTLFVAFIPLYKAYGGRAVLLVLIARDKDSFIVIRGKEERWDLVSDEGTFRRVVQVVAAVREDRSLDVDTVLEVLSVFNETSEVVRSCGVPHCADPAPVSL